MTYVHNARVARRTHGNARGTTVRNGRAVASTTEMWVRGRVKRTRRRARKRRLRDPCAYPQCRRHGGARSAAADNRVRGSEAKGVRVVDTHKLFAYTHVGTRIAATSVVVPYVYTRSDVERSSSSIQRDARAASAQTATAIAKRHVVVSSCRRRRRPAASATATSRPGLAVGRHQPADRPAARCGDGDRRPDRRHARRVRPAQCAELHCSRAYCIHGGRRPGHRLTGRGYQKLATRALLSGVRA